MIAAVRILHRSRSRSPVFRDLRLAERNCETSVTSGSATAQLRMSSVVVARVLYRPYPVSLLMARPHLTHDSISISRRWVGLPRLVV